MPGPELSVNYIYLDAVCEDFKLSLRTGQAFAMRGGSHSFEFALLIFPFLFHIYMQATVNVLDFNERSLLDDSFCSL